MTKPRHFLTLADRDRATYRSIFARARALKQRRVAQTLAGRTLVLLMEKASTRTRLSFEAAMFQLGGHAIDLPISASQVQRGEPIEDTARVIAGYADVCVFRTHGDDRMAAFAGASNIPVINGLTDGAHPVQLVADLFTVEERLGALDKLTIAFVGDGATNMGRSFVRAAGIFGFQLRIASPQGYRAEGGPNVVVGGDPRAAVAGADVVVTDVWTSMGQEAETAARLAAFAGFQVDAALLALAKPSAIVLHCLPAHRGEEISADVIDGKQSAVWDEAENRMHVQKALLEDVLGVLPVSRATPAVYRALQAFADAAAEDVRASGMVSTVAAPVVDIVDDAGDDVIFVFDHQHAFRAQSGSDWDEHHLVIARATVGEDRATAIRVFDKRVESISERDVETYTRDAAAADLRERAQKVR
jgi:ornithine carbamoyltransferase